MLVKMIRRRPEAKTIEAITRQEIDASKGGKGPMKRGRTKKGQGRAKTGRGINKSTDPNIQQKGRYCF